MKSYFRVFDYSYRQQRWWLVIAMSFMSVVAAVAFYTFNGYAPAIALTKGKEISSNVRPEKSVPQTTTQTASLIRTAAMRRNLALQPEAFKMGRRLGQRFSIPGHEVSVLSGTLTIGSEQQRIRILRRQKDKGEDLEVALNGRPVSLTWNEDEGAKGKDNSLDTEQQLVVERLLRDNPDRFVLAQIKGASYYTIARNARPIEAGNSDDYTGPVWDIVRVDEPQNDASGNTQRASRLYYINSATGLIDRVVSREQGLDVTAEITDWSERAGEQVPAHIVWTRQGQVIMDFRLNNFTLSPLEQAQQ